MAIELRRAALDDPEVLRLARAMSEELVGRQAHEDAEAAEHQTPIADSVGSQGEILLYVMPSHRGTGVAKRLLEALEERARQQGFDSVRLDTHDRLEEANRLYVGAGYREIADYNGNPSANRWFEKPLA